MKTNKERDDVIRKFATGEFIKSPIAEKFAEEIKKQERKRIIKEIPTKIEIFPDREGSEWGVYENNLIWTDGDTRAKMEEFIVPSLFWKNSAKKKMRDRLYVNLDELMKKI